MSRANKYADKWGMAPVGSANAQGQKHRGADGQTFSVFSTVPTSSSRKRCRRRWAELVTVSKALAAAGKVKFGYVGGMSMTKLVPWFVDVGQQLECADACLRACNKKLAKRLGIRG